MEDIKDKLITKYMMICMKQTHSIQVLEIKNEELEARIKELETKEEEDGKENSWRNKSR